jgi:hypothetical protein
MRVRRGAIAVTVLASMVLAACSSTGSSQPAVTTTTSTVPRSTTSTTISSAAAGAAYLAAVALANAALTTFSNTANSWTSSTTNAEAEADAQPAITALQALNTTLTNDQWPADAVADVHTLIGDTSAVSGDLQGLSSVNLLDASGWTATLQRDLASTKSAVALVRHDLGLPAATPD